MKSKRNVTSAKRDCGFVVAVPSVTAFCKETAFRSTSDKIVIALIELCKENAFVQRFSSKVHSADELTEQLESHRVLPTTVFSRRPVE